MANRLSTKHLPFVLFLVILLPDVSLAFHEQVRCQMFRDAIALSPGHLNSYLTRNFDSVHSGMHFADRNREWRSAIRPEDGENFYKGIVKDVREGRLNEYNTGHRFEVLACFVAEVISPGDHYSRESLIPKQVVYDGFQEVSDVDASMSSLLTKYRNPYRYTMNKQVSDFLYNVAVNQIVDFWTSAWQAGGKQAGALSPRGTKIAHEETVLQFNSGWS